MIERRTNKFGENGIFASAPIAKGTLLFSYSEWIEDEEFGWSVLSVPEVEALPESEREIFMKYGYDVDFGLMTGPSGSEFVVNNSNFMNHSCNPNMWYDQNDNIIAKRDIEVGEELTIDYANFVVNFDQTFECRCGAQSCRKFIRKDDWKLLLPDYNLNFPAFMHKEIRKFLIKVPA
ncbi:SET domain-containing protein-lysine N-methyltransferase [Leptospira perolatii]|uniref:SET domain-containing protein-lysine N-methyltransferase n=1 Tax=Leptospira perolatii TaxID=2023191 RepID=A0A2M9ZSG5_9LEPT|nr:SET domain-containing protein-lysine N-methyltransferase [Leptospira perolatii]PJZ71485.1 SET domain-containing protein-lysine N-methyltransferase [Leptospira perolatii]PJZ75020.1 SET domain-containing protein-lysine N-methyltransferase [Leptospira perolatii]